MFRPQTYVALVAGLTCACVMHLMYGRSYVEDRRRRRVHEEAAMLLKLREVKANVDKTDE
jgi:hypothetical protein